MKNKKFKGFIEFIRDQGIVGLATGFILGGAVQKVVQSLVTDIINPVVGLIGNVEDLAKISIKVGKIEILYGHFLSVFLDFLIIAGVAYFILKKLEKLEKPKDKK